MDDDIAIGMYVLLRFLIRWPSTGVDVRVSLWQFRGGQMMVVVKATISIPLTVAIWRSFPGRLFLAHLLRHLPLHQLRLIGARGRPQAATFGHLLMFLSLMSHSRVYRFWLVGNGWLGQVSELFRKLTMMTLRH